MNAPFSPPLPSRSTPPNRSAFTLVEILVVITIIGILASLSVAAITSIIPRARTAALRAEVQSLAEGIDRYQQKYGDYPPDFMNWQIVERHYRKIMPDIAASDLLLLRRLCDTEPDASNNQMQGNFNHDPTAMDRAEALVWALGGFSSDPQFPFTGVGGPLALLPGATVTANPALYHYNSDRLNGLVELDPLKMSLRNIDTSQPIGPGNRISTTDDLTGSDVFPVYYGREDSAPYVYFDSRTYLAFTLDGNNNQILNGFSSLVDGDPDHVRPVLSDAVNANTPVPNGSYGTRANALSAFQFMNERTFQLLSPGLDGRFGLVADADGGTSISDASNANPVYWQYPSGSMVVANAGAGNPQQLKVGTVSRYNVTTEFAATTLDSFEKDNLPSFGTSTFDNDLPSE